MAGKAREDKESGEKVWWPQRITATRCTDGEASDGLALANRSRSRGCKGETI